MLIQDYQDDGLVSALNTPWRLVTDGVMGGVSSGTLKKDMIEGKQGFSAERPGYSSSLPGTTSVTPSFPGRAHLQGLR